jgi:hypothetical protein
MWSGLYQRYVCLRTQDKCQSPGTDGALVLQAKAAFGNRDLGALQGQYLAEDVVWHVAGHGPLAGDYQGIAQVMASQRAPRW